MELVRHLLVIVPSLMLIVLGSAVAITSAKEIRRLNRESKKYIDSKRNNTDKNCDNADH